MKTFNKEKLLKELAKISVPSRPVLNQVKILDDLDYPVFTDGHVLIAFKGKQFTVDTQIDYRSDREKNRGVRLPDLKSYNYPDFLSKIFPNVTDSPEKWSSTAFNMGELLKNIEALKKEPNVDREYLYYIQKKKRFDSDKEGIKIGHRDVMTTYKRLETTLKIMKYAGATEELTFYFDNNPNRPFVIENENITAVLAPVSTPDREA